MRHMRAAFHTSAPPASDTGAPAAMMDRTKPAPATSDSGPSPPYARGSPPWSALHKLAHKQQTAPLSQHTTFHHPRPRWPPWPPPRRSRHTGHAPAAAAPLGRGTPAHWPTLGHKQQAGANHNTTINTRGPPEHETRAKHCPRPDPPPNRPEHPAATLAINALPRTADTMSCTLTHMQQDATPISPLSLPPPASGRDIGIRLHAVIYRNTPEPRGYHLDTIRPLRHHRLRLTHRPHTCLHCTL
jgi:hypothetical protein